MNLYHTFSSFAVFIVSSYKIGEKISVLEKQSIGDTNVYMYYTLFSSCDTLYEPVF